MSSRSPSETVTVHGVRPRFTPAPTPGNPPPGRGQGPDAIRDTMTDADLSTFGDAYNLGSPMGSDERSNETGGPTMAPRHP